MSALPVGTADPSAFSWFRASRASALVVLLIAGAAGRAAAVSTIYAGTWDPTSPDGGQVLVLDRVAGTWIPLAFPTPTDEVWDLELHAGAVHAATGNPNRVQRLDGTTWTDLSPPGGFDSAVTAVVSADGVLYATVRYSGLYRHEGGTSWTHLATMSPVARAIASDGPAGRSMVYMGEDFHDNFWVHDPAGLLGCAEACPSVTGDACPAGCFGGSCIHSMAEFDEGLGLHVYAGAYTGRLYRTRPGGAAFMALSPVGVVGHVQALGAFAGRLWAGGASAVLTSSPTPSSGGWTTENDFGMDQPISALLGVPADGELWVGNGGVPFAFARQVGTSMIRSFDGIAWTDRGAPGQFGRGVLAFLAVEPDSAITVSCDAGASRLLECDGTSALVTLDASGSSVTGPPGLVPSFEWSGPFAGSPMSGEVVAVELATPGTHVITLVVAAGGEVASCTTTVEVEDTVAPVLAGVPADASVPCDAVPPIAVVASADGCDPAPILAFDETWTPGPCPDAGQLVRTWTTSDASGNVATDQQVIDVADSVAPSLSGVPPDATVACDAVPPPAVVGAADDCDPAPVVAFAEAVVDGPCPDTYQLVRTWTGTDRCGNSASADQVLGVQDPTPPVLDGVPPDVTVECGAVPPPAVVTATDGCDPSPVVAFAEDHVDGPCAGTYQLVRTWVATDRCGNAASAVQVVSVQDTTPPTVAAGGSDLHCLWPPNHRYACFTREDFTALVADACSDPVTWALAGCASSQPADDRGDGHTVDDCIVSDDGQSLCVRAERDGRDPAGRRYGVAVVATDGCGNASAPTLIGFIHVPHDASRGVEDCVRGVE